HCTVAAAPAIKRRAVEVALCIKCQTSNRVGRHVEVDEGDQGGDGTGARGNLEDRAKATSAATRRCAVEVALRVQRQTGPGLGPVGEVEGGEGGEGAGPHPDLEHCAHVVGATLKR